MVEPSRALTSPAWFGLTAQRSTAELSAVGWWDERGPATDAEPVLTALSRAADPDLAIFTVNRLRGALGKRWTELDSTLRTNPVLRGHLFAVIGASTALGDFLVAHPEQWRRLTRGGIPVDASAELLAAVASGDGVATGAEAVEALRAGYRGLLLQVAAADLGHLVEPELPAPRYEEVTGALTELADAALRAAYASAVAEVRPDSECRLAVIAMGKCGGRELNYVSDVDVLFAADGDLRLATRLATATMRVAGEAAFEVDAALRPEGKTGALVRTLDSYASYYRRWAKTWEFQALLKARPVAGDTGLGQTYLDVVQPLVWTAADRENFVTDVQAMRRRVEEHIPPELVERELKLGRGGLRDVEFAVQLLQLVHGRSDESLRMSSTVDALRALSSGGYVGRRDAAELIDSYEFMRTLEHRLQLRKLRRTHVFPAAEDADELRWLARAVGVGTGRGRQPEQEVLREFRRHANRIRRLHEKLFYRPLLEAVARVPTEALRLTSEQAEARLAALGYAGPDGALHHIQALTAGVSRRAAIQGALLPVLLDLLATTPDPDGGLLAYRRISDALAETPWYLRLLRDEGAVVERLAVLLGTAKLIPDLVVRAPEGLRLLANTEELVRRDPAEVAASLSSAVSRHGYVGSAVATARSLRRHELFRVAAADVLGLIDVPDVCAALSGVWAAVLQATLRVVDRAETVAAGGRPATIAVIGMGRLGGAELGYGSDADVLFVCEPTENATEADAVRYTTRIAQTIRRQLSAPSQDPPLQVDADLRPEGRNGPLVRTLKSYRNYYLQWSDSWEAQALLRARFIAGDADLGRRFIEAIDPVRYPKSGLDAAQIREIRRLKARMENERMPRGSDPNTNTKLGRGSLADVEWTVQLLQLQHAGELPELRTTSTLDALHDAADAGLIGADSAEELAAAWCLATKVRNATMLVRGKPSDQIPLRGREFAAVARVAGAPDADAPGTFLDSYLRTTRRARAVVERVFYEQ